MLQGWPQLSGRFYGVVGKRDRGQIVMEIMALATVQRVARSTYPRPTFLPVPGSADVVTLRIHQKNIRASIHLLRSALHLPAETGQRLEISFVFNLNQEVDIFGILFVGCD